MPLLTGWTERLAEDRPEVADAGGAGIFPRSPSYFARGTTFVDTGPAASAMAELAEQRPLGWIGFDTEYRYGRPHMLRVKDKVYPDIRSIRPLLLSLAMVEAGPDVHIIYRFVVDLRAGETLPAVRRVLSLGCCFVGHFAKAELFCLWQLELAEPRLVWDTWVFEKAMRLGRSHRKYATRHGGADLDEAAARERSEAEEATRLNLVATCRRRGVEYPFPGDKERLQRSFLDHVEGVSFSDEQIEYAAADAHAAALLYPPQLQLSATSGVLDHLKSTEMPWVTTNSRMTWRGVRVDRARCRLVREACTRHLDTLAPLLAAAGVENVRSFPQLLRYFGRHGLLHLFRRKDGYSFDKESLSRFRDRHPAIDLIRAARKVLDMQNDRILDEDLDASDGRVHPEYRHLGTDTGRQTSHRPNVLGLGRVFRPLIVPEPGRGIGEVDLAQIEVGIAGAVYGDADLVAMFNSGDVYSAMAQRFYRAELPEDDRDLPGREFKRRHGPLRDRMKSCTLGILFGLTPHGLARQLGASVGQAERLMNEFLAMFPTLGTAQAESIARGTILGYSTTATGLRRNRASCGVPLSNWERNWMRNFPVQGTAAALFKAAGNTLDRLYIEHDAWLIVAMHDAFVFEAPTGAVRDVARLTRRVMCEKVQEFFPALRPRAEMNFDDPHCWNKEGHADSIDRWIEEPSYMPGSARPGPDAAADPGGRGDALI